MSTTTRRGQRARSARAKAGTRKAAKNARKTMERSVGQRIIDGLRQAVAFERGNINGVIVRRAGDPSPIFTARQAEAAEAPSYSASDVARIRASLGLSQDVFAQALNVSRAAVRSWEQGQSPPGGAALRLLEIAEQAPAIIFKALRWRPDVLDLDVDGRVWRVIAYRSGVSNIGSRGRGVSTEMRSVHFRSGDEERMHRPAVTVDAWNHAKHHADVLREWLADARVLHENEKLADALWGQTAGS